LSDDIRKIVYKTSDTGHWKTKFKQKNMLIGPHNLNKDEELVVQIDNLENSKLLDRNGKEVDIATISFKGIPNHMNLNITNARIIEALYGEHVDGWVGNWIQIYVAQVRNPAGKGTVPGLCVRREKPPEQTTQDDYKKTIEPEQLEIYKNAMLACKDVDQLKKVYKSLPFEAQVELEYIKEEMKTKFTL